jgi:hypothetical protein
MSTGAINLTVAWESAAKAVAPVGAPGKSLSVTLLDGEDAAPVPTALVAVTVKE